MTFFEWVSKVNEKSWMVCTMFQVPNDDRFLWRVTIGRRKPPHVLVTGEGKTASAAIEQAWLARKEKLKQHKNPEVPAEEPRKKKRKKKHGR